MSKTLVDTFDRANGALGSIPGGPAWEVLSGTFAIASNLATSSTAPGSNPIAVVPIGKRSNGSCDMYVEAVAQHVYGNAVYARVVDASNWLRVRVQSYTSSYYVTEYQHTPYTTEYQMQPAYWMDSYQPRVLQRQVQYVSSYTTTWVMGSWSAWNDTGETTTCRSSAPTTGTNTVYGSSGQAIEENRWVSYQTCSGGYRYKKQKRTRSETQSASPNYSYKWVNDGYSLGSNESFTGSTQIVNSGSVYYKTSSSTSSSNPGKTTSANGSYDVYQSTTMGYGGIYWTTNINNTPTPPGYYTGTTRQVAGTSYWDTNYEAGVPTRQAGPYTDYYYGQVLLEKCVAGTITQLGSMNTNSSAARVIAIECIGNSVKALSNGSAIALTTDSTHRTTGTKAGIGGGASAYNAQTPSLNNFSVEGISPERVRVGSTWQTMNRKVRVGTTWVDTDTIVK